LETDPLLDLLHSELKQMIAQTITPAWKERVLALAGNEDRKYRVVSAFKVELASAFAQLANFPTRYAKFRGKMPAVVTPAIVRPTEDQEPVMPREVLAEKLSDFNRQFFGRRRQAALAPAPAGQ
jgi:hypothetical protein